MSEKKLIRNDIPNIKEEKIVLPDPKDFPPNTEKFKNNLGQKEIKKVIKGTIVDTNKSSFWKKISNLFFTKDVEDVKSYIFYDVIIPALKKALYESLTGGLDMTLYGRKRNPNFQQVGSTSTYSYNSIYNRPTVANINAQSIPISDQQMGRNYLDPTSKARHDFSSIILQSRDEAELVLGNLVELTYIYGQATIADLYDLLGITSTFVDNKYGWKGELATNSSVVRVKDGYLIDLPKPIQLTDI